MPIRSNLLVKHMNYQFQDETLLNQALTHSSYAKNVHQSLEFMGDSVLSVIVADLLLRDHWDESSGYLTKARSLIVNNENLSKTLQYLELEKYIIMGKGQTLNLNICADTFEALVGAIYLDGGYEKAYEAVKVLYKTLWSNSMNNNDFKTQLQEYTQKKMMKTPEYKLLYTSGLDHDQTFTVIVCLNDKEAGRGIGRSKKSAEQEAAKIALNKIKK